MKWLGAGVMLHLRDPAGAVESALAMVGQVPETGLPPAQAGHVLVTAAVAEAPSDGGVAFTDLGELRLKGFAAPVRVLEARRA